MRYSSHSSQKTNGNFPGGLLPCNLPFDKQ